MNFYCVLAVPVLWMVLGYSLAQVPFENDYIGGFDSFVLGDIAAGRRMRWWTATVAAKPRRGRSTCIAKCSAATEPRSTRRTATLKHLRVRQKGRSDVTYRDPMAMCLATWARHDRDNEVDRGDVREWLGAEGIHRGGSPRDDPTGSY
jgi:hypothetical protein